jgi:peptidyl-prolyl cis-trans isomerase D
MLQAINDRIKGWLGAIVIGFISLPFALWGIQSYIGGAEAPYAAKIGDIEVSTKELDYNLTRQKQELRERFGNQLPFEDSMLKGMVLDQLINRKILESYTTESGYRVSDAQLSSNIKSLFSQDGSFDRAVFESIVRSRGQTIPQFEDEVRNEIRVQQFSNGLRATALVTNAELEQLAKLEAQQREISLLKFDVSNQVDSVSVSDADVQAAYDARIEQFMTDEQVAIDYIELTGEQVSKEIKLDEQKIKQAYDEYVAQVSQREQRKASHILVKIDPDRDAALAKLEKVKQALAAGEAFSALAKQYSEDTGSAENGGDLDWVERGQMVKPFEDALFAMASTGDVSDIVESQFGLHLIKLDDIRKEKPASLEAKRNEIETDLKRDIISSMFYDQSELLATTSYENPDSLDYAAEASGLTISKTDLMTRNAGNGIAAEAKIREAAFSQAVLSQGVNSDVIELAPDHVVVLRVSQHIPARKIPLEEVRSEIYTSLQLEKARAETLKLAREAKAKILAGTPAANLVAKGVTLDSLVSVKRTGGEEVDRAALQLAFDMAKPEAGKVNAAETALGGADVAVVILHKVITPEKVEQSQLDAIKQRLVQEVANAEYNAALAEISADYEVQKNLKVLE